MKISKFQAIFWVMLMMNITGCLHLSISPIYSNKVALHDDESLFNEKERFAVSFHYWQRAHERETVKDWYMARYFLRIAHQLDPANDEIASKIAMLTEKIMTESKAHFQKGLESYGIKDLKKAHSFFLEALRINPENRKAFRYLVEILNQPEQKTFYVAEEKGMETIAQEVYGDAEKSFLIAYFNDLQDKSVPEIGSDLVIPPIPENTPSRDFDLEQNLASARSSLEFKQYSRTLKMTAKIQKHIPDHPEALELEKEVYYQIAREFEKFGKYTDALNVMRNIKINCETSQSYTEHLQQLVKDRADFYYRRGVRYFVNEELEKAISEWKKALAIDPANMTTQKDIKKAENLLEKLREIE